jgi:hypothetical protein
LRKAAVKTTWGRERISGAVESHVTQM